MLKITEQEFIDRFDEIFDDCVNNKQEYEIETENGNVVLVPYEELP